EVFPVTEWKPIVARDVGRRLDSRNVAVEVDAGVCAEEPKPTLADEAPDVPSVVEPPAVGHAHLGDARVSGLEPPLGRGVRGVVIHEGIAVKLIPARFGDDVDDASKSPAVLGLIAARLDFDLLDELVVDGFALNAFVDVGRVDAIDDPAVFGRGRAIDRES